MGLIETCQAVHAVMPAAGAGVSITASGVSWGNSAWVEVEDSTAAAWLLTGATVGCPSQADYAEVHLDIGTGAGGAETVIATFPFYVGWGSCPATSWLMLPIPIQIAASTRVAVRLRQSRTDATTWKVILGYYPAPVTGTIVSTTQPFKALPAASFSGDMTASTAWTWSSWVELTSGLGSAVALGWLTGATPFGSTGWYQIAVGSGSAGAETPLAMLMDSTGWPRVPHRIRLKPLIEVPASTRLAVRARHRASLSARAYHAGLGYYELPL